MPSARNPETKVAGQRANAVTGQDAHDQRTFPVTMHENARSFNLPASTSTDAVRPLTSVVAQPAKQCGQPTVFDHVDTAIMRLFREWEAARNALKAACVLPETPENEAIYKAADRWNGDIEDKILALPAQTAQDFIAKVAILTFFGRHALQDEREDPAFWSEARRMMGYTQ